MIRYRNGIDRRTGRPLRGWAHARQSIEVILRTVPEERWMLLGFGCRLLGRIGRNMVPAEVLGLYMDVIPAIHRWEPEFRVSRMAPVRLDRTGAIGIGIAGAYYPEGRLGNFKLSEPVSAAFAIGAAAVGADVVGAAA